LTPLTKRIASEASSTSGSAISSGVALRPTGAWKYCSMKSRPACWWKAGSIGVSVGAGDRQFMRIRRGSSETARCIVYQMMHCFENR